MHVLAGLPRSGSTLLCNILNQNPQVHASSTSILPGLVENMITLWSQSPDIKGDLGRDRKATEDRLAATLRGMVAGYYGHVDKEIIIDKSRGWNIMHLPLMYLDSKIVVLVRDIREVLASIEKQHLKNPILDQAGGLDGTLMNRCNNLLSPKGIVGMCLLGIQDMLQRNVDVLFVRYEDLVAEPEEWMERIYCYLLADAYKHDFDNVVNTSTDPDNLYLYKFPHEGSGKVKRSQRQWNKFLSEPIGKNIVSSFPWFYKKFDYVP